jgi:hypothetical protein
MWVSTLDCLAEVVSQWGHLLQKKEEFSDFLDRRGGTYKEGKDPEGGGTMGLFAGGGMPLGLEVQGDGVSEMKSFAQVLAGTKVGLAGVRRSL